MKVPEYDIRPIGFKQAQQFVIQFHRHNAKAGGCKWCIGAYKDDELFGVAITARPVARYLDDGLTLEVVRVCVKPGSKNANSMLYGRVVKIARAMGYTKIITYTLKKESQSSLKAVGARAVAETKPQTWSRLGRKRKNHPIYQEEKIRWEL